MMDAFTAQDTVDIMLAPSEASRQEETAPVIPEEPIVFSRRRDPEGETEEETDLTVEEPTPASPAPEEEKGTRRERPALFGGESKFFGIFMLVAALLLAVILLVGIFMGEGEEKPEDTRGTCVSSPLTAEDPYAL